MSRGEALAREIASTKLAREYGLLCSKPSFAVKLFLFDLCAHIPSGGTLASVLNVHALSLAGANGVPRPTH